MRTLSTALATALGAPVQQPGFLVQMGFSTVRRWSSFATTTWNGQTWTKEAITVDGLAVDALRVRGTLTIGNADDAIGALILAEGVQDRPISIWGYDAAATATGDVVWLCDAVGASAEVGQVEARIALRHPGEFQLSPRTFINAAAGFTQLLPAGAVLRINGIDWKLQRRD
jgi:hypothetical protein